MKATKTQIKKWTAEVTEMTTATLVTSWELMTMKSIINPGSHSMIRILSDDHSDRVNVIETEMNNRGITAAFETI